MPEDIGMAAGRMCRTFVIFNCTGCPLDAFSPCASTAALPDRYPQEVQIIRDWAAAHPPKEAQHG